MGQDEKKENIWNRRGLAAVALLLIVIAVVTGAVRAQAAARRRQEEQARLASLAAEEALLAAETEPEETEPEETGPEETKPPYVSPIDFEALWEENPDVVGWITIPGTRIDYPILHDPEDNERYLHMDINGKESVHGSIYLDADSEPDFSGWNNPVYGHHMKDGSMFKDVVKFKEENYFKEHQYFEIYTPGRTIHLKAVSCYYGSSDEIARKTKFKSQEDFDLWLQERLEPCSYAEIPEEQIGSVFMLVTCSYEMEDARTFLFAVEVDEDGEVVPSGLRFRLASGQ